MGHASGPLCKSLIDRRQTHSRNPLNADLFLGGTFLGWVAALVWAFTDNVDTPRAAIFRANSQGDECPSPDLSARLPEAGANAQSNH